MFLNVFSWLCQSVVSGVACVAEHIQLCKGSLTITKTITIWLNITISARLIRWQLERYSLNRCHRQRRSYSITGLIAKIHWLGSLERQVYSGTPNYWSVWIKIKFSYALVLDCTQGLCQRATTWRPARLSSPPILVLACSPKPWPKHSRTLTDLS